MFWLLISCTEKEVDSVQLPPEDTYVAESLEPSFETEPSTEGTAFDESPPQMLQILL